MFRFASCLVLILFLFQITLSAEKFGDKGSIEIGGNIGFNYRKYSVDESARSIKLSAIPLFRYFFVNYLFIGISLSEELNFEEFFNGSHYEVSSLFSIGTDFGFVLNKGHILLPTISMAPSYIVFNDGNSYKGFTLPIDAGIKIVIAKNVGLNILFQYKYSVFNESKLTDLNFITGITGFIF